MEGGGGLWRRRGKGKGKGRWRGVLEGEDGMGCGGGRGGWVVEGRGADVDRRWVVEWERIGLWRGKREGIVEGKQRWDMEGEEERGFVSVSSCSYPCLCLSSADPFLSPQETRTLALRHFQVPLNSPSFLPLPACPPPSTTRAQESSGVRGSS